MVLIDMGNYEKMEVWTEAKELAVRVYQLTNEGEFSKDYSFRDQIRRAAISVPSNLAEGEESIFEKVSIKLFGIASASLAELKTQLEIAKEIGYIEELKYQSISANMIILSKRIKKLVQYRQNQLKET